MSPIDVNWHKKTLKLRIPMRGYERTFQDAMPTLASYESPWGVMSRLQTLSKSVSNTLRIPMRGYEVYLLVIDTIIIYSYESPWGVMSLNSALSNLAPVKLRIPMRGYELCRKCARQFLKVVTNPHEGLWEWEVGILIFFFKKVTNPHEGLWGSRIFLP